MRGEGVPRDEAKAAGWLAKAAAMGNADAQLEYAIALGASKGVPEDEAGAVALFRLAAERGEMRSRRTGSPGPIPPALAWTRIAFKLQNGIFWRVAGRGRFEAGLLRDVAPA